MVGVNVVSPGPSGARDGTFSSRPGIVHCSGCLQEPGDGSDFLIQECKTDKYKKEIIKMVR